jgi:hypothetical protein
MATKKQIEAAARAIAQTKTARQLQDSGLDGWAAETEFAYNAARAALEAVEKLSD